MIRLLFTPWIEMDQSGICVKQTAINEKGSVITACLLLMDRKAMEKLIKRIKISLPESLLTYFKDNNHLKPC